MKDKSLIFSEVFWSLLQYYKSGTRDTFSRSIVSKSLDFAGVQLDNEQLKRVRSYLFKRLQDFALIDVIKDGSSTWSSLKNGLIPFDKNKVIIFGDKQYQAKIGPLENGVEQVLHTLYEFPTSQGYALSLILPFAKIPRKGFEPSERFYSKWGLNICNILPSIEKVNDQVLIPKDNPAMASSLSNVQFYETTDSCWNAIDARDLKSHFFRCSLDDQRPGLHQSFVIIDDDTESRLFEISRSADDWGFFSACSKLETTLHWYYARSEECLSIPQEQLLLMPGLIRRFLCTASMVWPLKSKGRYHFRNVTSSMCDVLRTKYGFLRITNDE